MQIICVCALKDCGSGAFLKRRKVNAVFGHRDCAYNAQRSPLTTKQYALYFQHDFVLAELYGVAITVYKNCFVPELTFYPRAVARSIA